MSDKFNKIASVRKYARLDVRFKRKERKASSTKRTQWFKSIPI